MALSGVGCATLSQNECNTADWRSIGLEDGSRGYPVNRVGAHRKACSEYGIQPDLEQYRLGHGEGVRIYCQPENGYQIGKRGDSLSSLCPDEMKSAFRAGYAAGKEIYSSNQAVKDAQKQLAITLDQLETVTADYHNQSDAIVTQGNNPEQRAALLAEIKSLMRQKSRLQRELEDNNQILHEAESRLHYLLEESLYE